MLRRVVDYLLGTPVTASAWTGRGRVSKQYRLTPKWWTAIRRLLRLDRGGWTYFTASVDLGGGVSVTRSTSEDWDRGFSISGPAEIQPGRVRLRSPHHGPQEPTE